MNSAVMKTVWLWKNVKRINWELMLKVNSVVRNRILIGSRYTILRILISIQVCKIQISLTWVEKKMSLQMRKSYEINKKEFFCGFCWLEIECKPCWCRCLATGNPNCFEEEREEKATDDQCYCKQIYRQMEPTPDSKLQKVYSSTYFIDYRDPDYNYIQNKMNIKKVELQVRIFELVYNCELCQFLVKLVLVKAFLVKLFFARMTNSLLHSINHKLILFFRNWMKNFGHTKIKLMLKMRRRNLK